MTSAASKGSVSLADVAPARQHRAGSGIISLDHNSSIKEALETLAKNGILSAPVLIAPDLEDLGELRTEQPRPQLLGWVDVNDIVRAFIESVEGKIAGKRSMLLMMAELEEDAEVFVQRKLITLVGSEDRRLVYEGDRDLPLREAVRKYFLESAGSPAVHRVAVFDSAGAIEHVISQMDVMQFVFSRERDADWMGRTLEATGLLAPRELVAVDINTPTLFAMQRLVRHGRSAVAVLSPDGKLVTNLSSSDLRFLQPNHFGVLALPVGEFLGLLHGAVYVGAHAVDGDLSHVPAKRGEPEHHQFFASKGDSHKAQVPLLTVGKGATVRDAMAAMLDKHVHRVYVVEDAAADLPTPLAVVTTSDMMEVIAEHSQA